uniref:Potassium channel domain-containing protein n=1 Tax=Romanomermis culicivorax TaxID=13658 RepID=A0A915IMV1_ROMCU
LLHCSYSKIADVVTSSSRYGHVTPNTDGGKIFVIFYSLFGIPLMLTFLANIGEWMARIFRTLYYGCCCSIFLTKRRKHYDRMRLKAEFKSASFKWFFTDFRIFLNLRDNAYGNGCQKNRPPEDGHLNLAYDQARTNSQIRLRTTVSDKIDLADVECLYDGNDFYAPIENPDDFAKPNFPVSLTLGVIGAYIVLGAVLFSGMYGWSRTTAAYFSFVTLSTIDNLIFIIRQNKILILLLGCPIPRTSTFLESRDSSKSG